MTCTGGTLIEAVDLARNIVDLAAEKKAENIVLLYIREQTVIADYFIICSGSSDRQIKAIVNEIAGATKEQFGVRVRAIEGEASGGWVLMDYGDVIVHVFSAQAREYYDLEGFWSESPVLLKMQ